MYPLFSQSRWRSRSRTEGKVSRVINARDQSRESTPWNWRQGEQREGMVPEIPTKLWSMQWGQKPNPDISLVPVSKEGR